jgi:hypothetical protein
LDAGLLHITNPTEEEKSTAKASIREAVKRANSGPGAPALPN